MWNVCVHAPTGRSQVHGYLSHRRPLSWQGEQSCFSIGWHVVARGGLMFLLRVHGFHSSVSRVFRLQSSGLGKFGLKLRGMGALVGSGGGGGGGGGDWVSRSSASSSSPSSSSTSSMSSSSSSYHHHHHHLHHPHHYHHHHHHRVSERTGVVWFIGSLVYFIPGAQVSEPVTARFHQIMIMTMITMMMMMMMTIIVITSTSP